eukprot:UN18044
MFQFFISCPVCFLSELRLYISCSHIISPPTSVSGPTSSSLHITVTTHFLISLLGIFHEKRCYPIRSKHKHD